jgi:hypothetical protein
MGVLVSWPIAAIDVRNIRMMPDHRTGVQDEYRLEDLPGGARQGGWEPASYNVWTADGREMAGGVRCCGNTPHGLTVISHYRAPPGKAWKIVGKASALGEEVYILEGAYEGAYYDTRGRILAGPGTFMFNAPGARHGGISSD